MISVILKIELLYKKGYFVYLRAMELVYLIYSCIYFKYLVFNFINNIKDTINCKTQGRSETLNITLQTFFLRGTRFAQVICEVSK